MRPLSWQSADRDTLPSLSRRRLQLRGIVQGVGFRPFVYRLATELGLSGWVCNSSQGVELEVEGPPELVASFQERLLAEQPALVAIRDCHSESLEPLGDTGFVVQPSTVNGPKTASILPDLATCPECRREIFDPDNRRYRYPFTTCTYCGPRFSIIEGLPYDRDQTTMKHFPLCPECRAEYHNPADRRFQAQAIACPKCGPHLELWDRQGRVIATHDDALRHGAAAIREGKIVALQGLGGFQLLVDATQEAAVQRLRQRKARPAKPLALMYPALAMVKTHVSVTASEEALLRSPEAPIVLLRRRLVEEAIDNQIAPAVAPGNLYLGIMLPYTPLHHLLMDLLPVPIVATSGNRAGEPLCISPAEALQQLGQIADRFLVHNRPIVRPLDDSLAQVVWGQTQLLRRARGYVPQSIAVPLNLPPLLAVGGHQKNTLALAGAGEIYLSQHIGDLETVGAEKRFQEVRADFLQLYDRQPEAVAADRHPEYYSTKAAERLNLPCILVQHHYAHILAAMAEHGLVAPLLGVAWDGSGYGLDNTIWGGEFLEITAVAFQRVASLRTFPLPGGEAAIKEPRRIALGVLYEIFGPQGMEMSELAPLQSFSAPDRRILTTMIEKGLNCPLTSSMGRLFDAVAALVDLRQQASFEGQAAMELESAANQAEPQAVYPFRIDDHSTPLLIDWEPLIRGILQDLNDRRSANLIAARFHHTLAAMIVQVAQRFSHRQVVLSGGCFQNRYLTEKTLEKLEDAGFQPYCHHLIPPNDGGLAVGQIMAAQRSLFQR
ncbi:MAG: carbamoyltransferase HypF [Desulfobacca sp. 4484_104]|nr:MAG: carbamoyltransferase HypF [Desulfobacca sp. 4484_104]RLA89642.1 MAG: carbamoyltransferase HypF [Deltaproteobacteria bacterium]